MLFKESWDHRKNKAHKDHFDMTSKIGVFMGDKNHPDSHAIGRYVSDSFDLNYGLLSGRELDDNERRIHDAVMRNAKPSPHNIVTYSGTRHDFGKMGREAADGIVHAPAHISTSSNLDVAHKFARMSVGGENRHIVRVHIKEGDKVLPIGTNNGEYETVIPAGTKLKYHGTKTHIMRDKSVDIRPMTHYVHSFSIHSQD